MKDNRYEEIWQDIKAGNKGQEDIFMLELWNLFIVLKETADMGVPSYETAEELLGEIDFFCNEYNVYEALIKDFNRNDNPNCSSLRGDSLFTLGLEQEDISRFENSQEVEEPSSLKKIFKCSQLVFWANRLTKVLEPISQEIASNLEEKDEKYFRNHLSSDYVEEYERGIAQGEDPEELPKYKEMVAIDEKDERYKQGIVKRNITPDKLYSYFKLQFLMAKLYAIKDRYVEFLMLKVKEYNENLENEVKISAGIERDGEKFGKYRDSCVVDMPGYNIPLRVHISGEIKKDIMKVYQGIPIYEHEIRNKALIMFRLTSPSEPNKRGTNKEDKKKVKTVGRATDAIIGWKDSSKKENEGESGLTEIEKIGMVANSEVSATGKLARCIDEMYSRAVNNPLPPVIQREEWELS